MIKRENKKRVIEEINENKLENIFNIIPNLSDKVIDYVEKEFCITELIDKTFNDNKKYKGETTPSLFILSGIQSRMKQQFSISALPLALTSKEVIQKLGCNISYNEEEGLLKESTIRLWLQRHEQEDKTTIEFNDYYINYCNELNQKLFNKSNTTCNIHILDCSVLDVNIDNENYEGSTITQKGGKNLRGYKIGMLRGVIPNGGIIEEICMSTAKTNDFEMSKEMIKNSKYLKAGDYLLEDRGFLDIQMLKYLHKKGILVIVPSKKNMEIYKTAVSVAVSTNEWIKHPNSKRQGQDISLIRNMEMFWLADSDKNKKPENLKLDYSLNCCVIRFEKEKNKKLLSDDEVLSEDDKYAYACIVTNDTSLSCSEIIRLYEQRPEIEEDFRQLKDFWGLNSYNSTKYHVISFIIMISLMGYNFYQLYKESEEGKKYIGKSLIVEERHGLYIVKGVRTAIVTEHYFAIFEQDELLDLYADLDKTKRELVKQYLTL